MFKGRISAAVALAWLPVAVSLRAQSLADAARAAEVQRATTGRATREYSNDTLGGASRYEALLGSNYLLADHFSAYATARDRVAQVRMQHFELDKWLYEQTAKAKDRFELEQIYGQDRTIMWALGEITPREYFKTDFAFARAVDDYHLNSIDRDHLPPARKANAQYIQDHQLANWAKNIWAEQQLESRRVSRGYK